MRKRHAVVPPLYQRAVDEARRETARTGFHDERAEVMQHWTNFHTWIRAPVALAGDVLQSNAVPIQLVVGLAFAVIAFFAARSRHDTVGNEEIYKYPSIVGYLMAGSGCFFALIPFLTRGRGDTSPALFLFFATFAAGAFAAAMYFFRYRVVVSDTTLTYGTFGQTSVLLTDVMDSLVTSGRNPQMTVYLRDGRRLKFSGMLGDFGNLVTTINTRRAGPPTGSGDWLPKLEDQRKQAAFARRLNWMMGVGLALLAVIWLTTRLIR
jgi:hypothetical protein